MCDWYKDDPEDTENYDWATSCGRYMGFEDGGPINANWKFCPFCGERLAEIVEHEEPAAKG